MFRTEYKSTGAHWAAYYFHVWPRNRVRPLVSLAFGQYERGAPWGSFHVVLTTARGGIALVSRWPLVRTWRNA